MWLKSTITLQKFTLNKPLQGLLNPPVAHPERSSKIGYLRPSVHLSLCLSGRFLVSGLIFLKKIRTELETHLKLCMTEPMQPLISTPRKKSNPQ